MKRPLRVLHCPEVIGSNPPGLARAERELGIKSWSVAFEPRRFALEPDQIWARAGQPHFWREFKRWELLYWAWQNFDIIHFNFGQTILPSLVFGTGPASGRYPPWIRRLYHWYARCLNMCDLPLLKRAGKGLVVTFQGDDARQGDYSQAHFELSMAQEVEAAYYTAESDALKRRVINKFDCYTDRIFYLNPDLGHVLPERAKFMPYAHVDLREWLPISKTFTPFRPQVIHAPTHRGAKGTNYVLEAVNRLQAEGIAFDFVLVEGLAYSEARPLYERADLLIDQLLAGWYGGLAVELMALSKPVICYLREADLKFIPPQMRQDLPIINTTPASLYSVLREWLTVRKPELAPLGQRSRAYVERWHDPLKIAAQLKAEYELIMTSKQKAK